jgi:hypothetical protein
MAERGVPDTAFQWQVSAKKFIKGTLGGLAIFAALRAGLGRDVGWPEVQAFQGLLEVIIAAAFGCFEAVWGAIKWWREQQAGAAKPPAPEPEHNFTWLDKPTAPVKTTTAAKPAEKPAPVVPRNVHAE